MSSPQASSMPVRPRPGGKRKTSDNNGLSANAKKIRMSESNNGTHNDHKIDFFTLVQFSVLKSIIMTLGCPNCNGMLVL